MGLSDRLRTWERYQLLSDLFIGDESPEDEWLLDARFRVLNGQPVPDRPQLPAGDPDAMLFVLETLAAGAAASAVHLAAFSSELHPISADYLWGMHGPFSQILGAPFIYQDAIEHATACATCSSHFKEFLRVSAMHHGLDLRCGYGHWPAEPHAQSGWGHTYKDCCRIGHAERERHDAAECTVRYCPPCRLDLSLLVGIWDTLRDVTRGPRWADTADRLSTAVARQVPIRLMLGDVPWRELIDGTYGRGRWADLLYRDTRLRGRSPLAGDPDLRYTTGRLGLDWHQARRSQRDFLEEMIS